MMKEIADFFDAFGARLEKAKSIDYVLGGAAVTVLALMKRRIFADGLASDNSDIGRYSLEYLQRRIEEFKRGNSPRVILTATAQMRNDLQLIKGVDFLAFGFNNEFNAKKAFDNEKRFKKRIFALSDEEKNTLLKLLRVRVNDIFAGRA
ncbi:MAG: hypothetical protein RMM53_01225 [Bacteroidia bacterium]|nr:hypothetical protein [Bacteroidia bacterium]